jgi:hypothetical protein
MAVLIDIIRAKGISEEQCIEFAFLQQLCKINLACSWSCFCLRGFAIARHFIISAKNGMYLIRNAVPGVSNPIHIKCVQQNTLFLSIGRESIGSY